MNRFLRIDPHLPGLRRNPEPEARPLARLGAGLMWVAMVTTLLVIAKGSRRCSRRIRRTGTHLDRMRKPAC